MHEATENNQEANDVFDTNKRFVEIDCPRCGQPTVVDTQYDEQSCDWVDDEKSRREGEVCGEAFELDELTD